jgi:hypothetical protein
MNKPMRETATAQPRARQSGYTRSHLVSISGGLVCAGCSRHLRPYDLEVGADGMLTLVCSRCDDVVLSIIPFGATP